MAENPPELRGLGRGGRNGIGADIKTFPDLGLQAKGEPNANRRTLNQDGGIRWDVAEILIGGKVAPQTVQSKLKKGDGMS